MNEPLATLVSNSLLLAKGMAANTRGWLDPDDALSEAMACLWRAAQEWRSDNGCPFPAFASKVIRQGFCKLWRKKKTLKRGWGVQHVTWDEPCNGEDGMTWAERIEDKNESYFDSMCMESRESILKALPTLDPWHQKVIAGRFGLDGEAPKGSSEIAAELGFSKKLVESLERSGLGSLRLKTQK